MADQRVTELVPVVVLDANALTNVRNPGDTRDKSTTIQKIIDLVPSPPAEVNDLSAAVTWANVPIANIPFGNAGEQLTTNEAGTAMELQLASKYILARKGSAGTIALGAPVYISGYNVGGWIEVEEADASAAGTMPAIGLAFEAITNAATGRVLTAGNFVNIPTNLWGVGDSIYVDTTAGQLTNVKPIGTALVQAIGIVGRSNAINGQLLIEGAGRVNDLPNLAQDNLWVGDANGVPQEVNKSTLGGGGFPEYLFYADQFENPNNADWDVNALAPAAADSNNAALTVRLFDDTVQEAVGMSFRLPDTATNVVLDFVSRAETTPGAAVAAKPALESRTIGDNVAVPAPPWNTLNLTKIDLPTNENFQYDSQTISFATLSWTAGTYVQMQLTRNPAHPDDDLVGDWALLSCRVSFT